MSAHRCPYAGCRGTIAEGLDRHWSCATCQRCVGVDTMAREVERVEAQRDDALKAGPALEFMGTCNGCQDDVEKPHTWKECHAVISADYARQHGELVAAEKERNELRTLIYTPRIDAFLESVRIEAAHQVDRWKADHDAGKAPQDWFWLLGWLSGKAVHAAVKGDREKALHHTISSAAVLLNWHAHMSGESTGMRPGIAEPEETGT